MKSLWSDADAAAAVAHYGAAGITEDVALRVYTTRLLGGDPRLVLHGGGNTSVKTTIADPLTHEPVEVLCVKGSGWDMGSIEPPGLPAVRLAPLQALAARNSLSDEDMVALQRRNLLDPGSPNPSVETLLHAFLPHKFIDHTHANAVLALTDTPDGEAICRDLYGDRVTLVPYRMPGFALAKDAGAVFASGPAAAEGMILLKHGIFSFGETAREAYERMIALVTMAEERIARAPMLRRMTAPMPRKLASPAAVAPILRGLIAESKNAAEGLWTRFVLEHRASAAILGHATGVDADRYARAGTITPDHVIRTKALPVLLPAPAANDLAGFAAAAKAAIDAYRDEYRAYFTRCDAAVGGGRTMLDPSPRLLLVPGLGVFAAGDSKKAASIAGDLAEAAAGVIADSERLGGFESIPEADLFDVEYWPLEQAKLGKAVEKPLARHVVVVTGAAGAIGRATAAAFKAQGAEVALLDRDAATLAIAAKAVGGLAVVADVTDPSDVAQALEQVLLAYGGIDVLVSNAGAAWQGKIGEVSDAILRESFELNFFAHQTVAQAAVRVMQAQGTGGMLLFNASKQAVNPGPDFGPYGLPKAATMALARQYAVDYGADGITSNAVNADRIRSGLLTDEMVERRSRARGVSEAVYMSGNMLGREVTAADVAQAFVALALARKTTGAVLTVDGGNIAAALR